MKIKLVLVDRTELHKGEEEESGEHGFDKELSMSVAAQHLDKKDPHYYSKADAAGLEEAIDLQKKEIQKVIQKVETNPAAKAEAVQIFKKLQSAPQNAKSLEKMGSVSKFGLWTVAAGLGYAAIKNPMEAQEFLKLALQFANMAKQGKKPGFVDAQNVAMTAADAMANPVEENKSGFNSNKGTGGDSSHTQGIPTGKNYPFTQKSGRLGKIKAAAKKGPVVAGGAGFGPN